MQKSKKMMVSLCGLALSSLFVLNNKSVVHADTTTDTNQNNAISWDSDSDQAQGVQSEQTQKADDDDDQQNAISVQPSRAEMSTVRSSSAAPRTTNQNAPVQSLRVSNVQDAQAAVPVVINNPANDKVHVHYIDSNGNAVDNSTHDYDIDATKTGQGAYTVPNGYSLNVPNGNYNVSGGKFGADTLKGNVEHHAAVTHKVTQWAEYDDNGQYKVIYGMSDYAKKHAEQEYEDNVLAETGDGAPKWQKQTKIITDKPAYDVQHLPVAFVDSNNNIVGMIQNYTGNAGTSQNINLSLPTGYKLADGATLPTSVTFQNSTNPLLVKVVPNGETNKIDNPQNNTIHVKFVDQQTGQDVGGSYGIDVSQFKTKKDANFDDDGFTADAGTYKVPSGYATQNNKFTVDYKFRSGLQHILSHYTPFSLSDIMSDDQMARLYQDDEDARNTAKADGYSNYDVNTAWIELGPYDDLKEASIGSGVKVDELNSINDGDLVLWLATSGASNLLYKPTHLSQYELHQIWSNYATNYADEYGGLKSDGTPINDIVLLQEAVPIGISDKGNVVNGNTVTVPVHKTNSFSFTDNSGNVKSVSGNTVDVTLTKPQSVNPAMDVRCQSQATRTIQINFPDGQIPEAYDGIVDKSGKLVQTVHFIRTATEDALTGNILQYGNWTSDNQDPNFIGFPERTLPRIPGYTLSIKPA